MSPSSRKKAMTPFPISLANLKNSFSSSCPDVNPDWRTSKAEVFTQALFNIAKMGILDRIRIVRKYHKGWRRLTHLGHVIQLDRFSLIHRQGYLRHDLTEEPVQLTGQYPLLPLLYNLVNNRKDLRDPLLFDPGNRQDRCILGEPQ